MSSENIAINWLTKKKKWKEGIEGPLILVLFLIAGRGSEIYKLDIIGNNGGTISSLLLDGVPQYVVVFIVQIKSSEFDDSSNETISINSRRRYCKNIGWQNLHIFYSFARSDDQHLEYIFDIIC